MWSLSVKAVFPFSTHHPVTQSAPRPFIGQADHSRLPVTPQMTSTVCSQ